MASHTSSLSQPLNMVCICVKPLLRSPVHPSYSFSVTQHARVIQDSNEGGKRRSVWASGTYSA